MPHMIRFRKAVLNSRLMLPTEEPDMASLVMAVTGATEVMEAMAVLGAGVVILLIRTVRTVSMNEANILPQLTISGMVCTEKH